MLEGKPGSEPALAPPKASVLSCAVIYEMAGSPRSIRSRLTRTKICSGMGSASTAASDTVIGPTPSSARALLIDVSQSALLAAMLPLGFEGGRMPVAPASDDQQS